MAVAEAHPCVEELVAFALGALDDEAEASIGAHVEFCASCQEQAANAPDDAFVELLRTVQARTGFGTDSVAERAAQLQTPPFVGDRAAMLEPSVAPPALAESDCLEVPDALPPNLARHERYQVVRLLGAGGMGAVYEAEHRVLKRVVALKIMKRAYTSSPAALERFRREVRAAARLCHPNIVTTHDAEDAGETHFLVMEYVEGSDLGRLVQERGPLSVECACDYVRQAALGLQYAFEQGMVHRDLKPQNLMLTNDGRVKILDFGLARFASEAADAAGLTTTGIVLGTVDYLSPEQADNPHQADIRSDIYGLGCTLYHLLAGQPPFSSGAPLQKLSAHKEKKPEPLTELRPDLPEELMPVLERMIAKNPKQRFQTPAEVAVALEPFTRAATVRTTDSGDTVDLRPPSRKRSRPRLALAIALLAFFVAGLMGMAVYRITTDNGVLIIEADNDDVEVVVSKAGKVVNIIDTKTGTALTLDSGDYELALKDGQKGLTISPEKMTLKRGETRLATITKVTHQQPASVNLIKNGSFEAGMEGWGGWELEWSHGGAPHALFEFDRDVVHEGRRSLRVTTPARPTDCGTSQLVKVKANHWYEFSGWLRTRDLKLHGPSRREAPLGWGTIIIQHPIRPGEPGWQFVARANNHSGDTEWTRVSFRFQAPNDTCRITLCPACFAEVTGTIWFDDLKLVETSPPPKILEKETP